MLPEIVQPWSPGNSRQSQRGHVTPALFSFRLKTREAALSTLSALLLQLEVQSVSFVFPAWTSYPLGEHVTHIGCLLSTLGHTQSVHWCILGG